MTAEIGILNSTAVALAADSAVTVTNRKGQKIFNSAHKLFQLSKYHPVGIMVYGNAQLSGVPWETIIKFYRKKLNNKAFPTLKEYGENFIKFITENEGLLFSSELKLDTMISLIHGIYRQLLDDIIDEMNSRFEDRDDEITSDEILNLFSEIVELKLSGLLESPYLEDNSLEDVVTILEDYDDIFNHIIDKVFDEAPLTEHSRKNLCTLAANYLCRDLFGESTSGIVIAGYGNNEFFPSIYSYNFEGIFGSKLKYKYDESKSTTVDHSHPGGVIPFAQDDMVVSIMTGIDPYLERFSKGLLNAIANDFPAILSEKLVTLLEITKESAKKQDLIKRFASQQLNELLSTYFDETKKYREIRHISPIVQSIHIMPKEELAIIAETLVNLTSFKRKISADAETVGGPIDVALITKGDGFIWIKRKHYFSAELNPHFFQNYLRSEKDDN